MAQSKGKNTKTTKKASTKNTAKSGKTTKKTVETKPSYRGRIIAVLVMLSTSRSSPVTVLESTEPPL